MAAILKSPVIRAAGVLVAVGLGFLIAQRAPAYYYARRSRIGLTPIAMTDLPVLSSRLSVVCAPTVAAAQRLSVPTSKASSALLLPICWFCGSWWPALTAWIVNDALPPSPSSSPAAHNTPTRAALSLRSAA